MIAGAPGTVNLTSFPDLPATVPAIDDFKQLQPAQQTLVHHNHDDQALKRRRIDAGGNAVNVSTNGTSAPQLSSEQLAAAAAQAALATGRGRKKSQAQVDRRRERNRILARRTRLRKKFFFESLQKEVMDLQQENVMLKELVKESLDADAAKSILEECDAMEKLPPAVLEACNENGELDSQDFNLVRSIQGSQHSFVITDPSLNDNPIVFASEGFLKMTGYSRDEVLGRNCRFLQGKETSKEKVKQIEDGIAKGDDVTVTFVNYTADGKPFWNKLFIAALRDIDNNIVNYIGVSVKVAAPAPGDPEHGKVLTPPKEEGVDDLDDNEAENAVDAIGDAVSAAVAAAAAH